MLSPARAQAAQQGVRDLTSQPSWVRGGALYPHQLEAANWLRRLWAEGRPALLADGGGLGKTASVITFLQSLRWESGAGLRVQSFAAIRIQHRVPC